jgi:hypothetical protein
MVCRSIIATLGQSVLNGSLNTEALCSGIHSQVQTFCLLGKPIQRNLAREPSGWSRLRGSFSVL